jgi:hypothetical protein
MRKDSDDIMVGVEQNSFTHNEHPFFAPSQSNKTNPQSFTEGLKNSLNV